MLFAILTFTMLTVVNCGWKQGRGTFYGNEFWLWNIHEGSCGYGYLCPEEGTGWDIAALPDAHWGYLGSCGRCYEVKCLPSTFIDNYGESLDRSGVCYDPEASVVVTITDTCPCNYASNWYSNQRWCCGDMDHLDLSVWAFEKFADTKWGVIGLQYQEVPCDHKPWKVAPAPENIFDPAPIPDGTVCPKGNFPLTEDWQYVQKQYRNLYANKGMYFSNQDAITWDEYMNWFNGVRDTKHGQDSQVQVQYPEYKPTEDILFDDSVMWNWKTSVIHTELMQRAGQGLKGTNSICGAVASGGVFDMTGPAGALTGKTSLEIWVKNDYGTPDIDVNVGGPSGFCAPIRLTDLYTSGSMDGFSRYDIYLGLFDPPRDSSMLSAKPEVFNGCLGLSSEQITTVRVRNNRLFEQEVCMDDIKLLG
eukprot:TRINITY_DN196_c0_g1_i5.p1 TRINITY_DN196_c0_g1~~TRINITY_DN196_c0_g1_i5.p1  ORF type:complete len:418 (-),score=51.86 TRINITY_DN196_c0_g1_i5:3505-4758(-)